MNLLLLRVQLQTSCVFSAIDSAVKNCVFGEVEELERVHCNCRANDEWLIMIRLMNLWITSSLTSKIQYSRITWNLNNYYIYWYHRFTTLWQFRGQKFCRHFVDISRIICRWMPVMDEDNYFRYRTIYETKDNDATITKDTFTGLINTWPKSREKSNSWYNQEILAIFDHIDLIIEFFLDRKWRSEKREGCHARFAICTSKFHYRWLKDLTAEYDRNLIQVRAKINSNREKCWSCLILLILSGILLIENEILHKVHNLRVKIPSFLVERNMSAMFNHNNLLIKIFVNRKGRCKKNTTRGSRFAYKNFVINDSTNRN